MVFVSADARGTGAFLNKNWKINQDIYGNEYGGIRKLRHDDAKYFKKHGEHYVKFKGTYDNDGRKTYILTYSYVVKNILGFSWQYDVEVHIVDGCWQINRITEKSPSREISTEFQEIFPDVFLPVKVVDILEDGDTEIRWSFAHTHSFQCNKIVKRQYYACKYFARVNHCIYTHNTLIYKKVKHYSHWCTCVLAKKHLCTYVKVIEYLRKSN